MRRIKERGSQW